MVAFRPEPRCLDGLLEAHPVIDEVHNGLHRRRENAHPARQTQREDGAILLQDDHWRHRCRHPFARGDRHRLTGARIVVQHVVIGNNAGAGNHDACAEQTVDRMCGGDDIPVTVGRCDMRGVAAFMKRRMRRRPFLHPLQAGAGIVLRNIAFHRHIDEIGVARCGAPVFEGNADHLGQQAERLHAAETHGGDVETLQHVQHLNDVHAG